MKEKDIQKAILDYLFYRGIFHYRNNTGAMRTSYRNRNGARSSGFIRFGVAGAPDIICVIKGRFVGLEVKTIKGKLSKSQEEFGEKLQQAGGVYCVVRSVDDVECVLSNLLTKKQ